MNDHSYNLQLSQLIARDLKLEDESMVIADHEDQLLEKLNHIIAHLLDHDMEKLLQTLYRIDVNEALVKRILSTSPPQQLSMDLSEAILHRMKKKLYYRKKYS